MIVDPFSPTLIFSALWRIAAAMMLAGTLAGTATPAAAAGGRGTGTYTNPLPVQIPGDGKVESCADPSLIRGQQPGDTYW